MRRMAIFVEGWTEVLFVERLICEIAGRVNIAFEKRSIIGGSKVPRKTKVIATSDVADKKFYVLLVDCHGDHSVKNRILEEHKSLSSSGYSVIVGLRDVAPSTQRADIVKLERLLKYGIKTSLIPVDIILAVMEIEAWFLSENSHFERIDPALTPAVVAGALGYDPGSGDMTMRDNPADDLNSAYLSVGKVYVKPAIDTINALDYSRIYLELSDLIDGLGRLIKIVDNFLAIPEDLADVDANAAV